MSNSASWNIERPWVGAEDPPTRIVNMNQLGRTLLDVHDPPVRVLFVYNANPVATVPDQRRIIAGLEDPCSGDVLIDGRNVAGIRPSWACT